MNSAKLDTSERLQRVYNVLKDGRKHSTMDLIQKSGRRAINSIVAELRDNGIPVDCQRKGVAWYCQLEDKK